MVLLMVEVNSDGVLPFGVVIEHGVGFLLPRGCGGDFYWACKLSGCVDLLLLLLDLLRCDVVPLVCVRCDAAWSLDLVELPLEALSICAAAG
jgi:hypothetical protein